MACQHSCQTRDAGRHEAAVKAFLCALHLVCFCVLTGLPPPKKKVQEVIYGTNRQADLGSEFIAFTFGNKAVEVQISQYARWAACRELITNLLELEMQLENTLVMMPLA